MNLLSAISLATNDELFIVFLLCQLTYLVSYLCFKKRIKSILPWCLLMIVCLYYVWDTDYYSYMLDYQDGMLISGAKEKIYAYLCELTTPYYLLWRFIIWGTAILLYYHTSRRLGIRSDVAVFVLITFFLSLFAYGRVILAMTLYYCGFSYLIKPSSNRVFSRIWGIVILSCSFFAHRSFLPIIVLTPIFFIPLNKKTFIALLLSTPIILMLLKVVFSSFINESFEMGSSFESFQASAERTTGLGNAERNWKGTAMTTMRNLSIYIPGIYFVYKSFFSKKKINIEENLKPLFVCIFIIMYISLCLFFGIKEFGTLIIAKRYLYMTGIGICLLLSFLYSQNKISQKVLIRLIFLGFALTEANFLITYIIHGYNIN